MPKRFEYYPDINDPKFYEKIFWKQEFNEAKIPEETRTIAEICNPPEFSLFPQQNFIKNYIGPNTPYNSLLIYHGTGVGKTCTAITVAENFRRHYKSNYKCVVLTPLKDAFVNAIYNMDIIMQDLSDKRQCTKDTYSLTDYEKKNIFKTKMEQKAEIVRRINKFYNVSSPLAFINEIKRKLHWNGDKSKLTTVMKKNIRGIFSNSLLIIDEVHILKKDNNATVKIIPPVLETIVKYATNLKLILMSATPVFNDVREIIFVANLLLQNDKRPLIKAADVFDSAKNFTPAGADILRRALRGYVSYLRSENPIKFPLKIYPKDARVLKYKYDSLRREPIAAGDAMQYSRLIPCEMSKGHYDTYMRLVYPAEGSSAKATYTEIPAISNIVLPGKNGESLYGKAMYGYNGPLTKNQTRNGYYYYNYSKFVKGKLFAEKEIARHSGKFHTLLQNIKRSTGIILVYTQYIMSGCIPIALMLEQNGVSRFTASSKVPSLLMDDEPIDPICYKCAERIGHKNHRGGSKNYHKFSKMTYMLVSGDKLLSPISTSEMLQVINNEKNGDGKTVRIILGTDVLAQGLDFKRLRQIHIMEPWYNYSKLEQIIGRGVRDCSHIALEPLQRNVEIFQYAAVPPGAKGTNSIETIDVHNYRLSEVKERKINNVKNILKEIAVDCPLNVHGNYSKKKLKIAYISSQGQRGTHIVDETPPECSAAAAGNGRVNSDTYDVLTNNNYSDKIAEIIKKMFAARDYYQLADIVKAVQAANSKIGEVNIYIEVHRFVGDKVPLVNRGGSDGYLIYRGKFYIFHPAILEDENAPLYYKTRPPVYHKYSVPIADLVTLQKNTLLVQAQARKIDAKSINFIVETHQAIMNNYHEIYDGIRTFIEGNRLKNYSQHLVHMVLDRLSIEQHIHIIQYLNGNRSAITEKIAEHLKTLNMNLKIGHYLRAVEHIYAGWRVKNGGDKKNATYRIAHNLIKYNIAAQEVVENIIDRVVERAGETRKINKKEVFGEMFHAPKKHEFKIHDHTKYTGLKTKEDVISRRGDILGRVCATIDKRDISRIYAHFGFKQVIKSDNKGMICNMLELYFRYMQEQRPGELWFTVGYSS